MGMPFLRKIMISIFLIPMAIVVLTEPILGSQSSSQSILSHGTIVYGQPSEVVFRETCDTWDTTKWSYTWNPPDVVDSTWVFNFPAGWSGHVQANYLQTTGYGTYKVRLRVTGGRVAGTKYWIFLYYAPDGDYASTHNELDFMEIHGGHPIGEYSLCFWVNGKSGVQNVGYWFFSTLVRAGINWEDGNWHQFTYVYRADDVIIFLNGVKIFKWTEDCEDVNALGIPFPPMRFMIGGKADGSTTQDFQFIIDEIEYTAPLK